MSCIYFWLFALGICFGAVSFGQVKESEEQLIRNMVAEAVSRFNNGDASVIRELWDEDADYVGVDGTLTTGRAASEELLGRTLKAHFGKITQNATIERVRFLAPDIVLVDGTWTITGAVDAAGKEWPAIRGFSSLVASTAALIATGWSEPVPGRVYSRCGPTPFTAHPVSA
jgi:uncharacterized protein (TIGR02246 family)